MNDRQRSSHPVTLEDLLRLKRAERPPAEFWADFEKSLRAKQLAAIVEKRPWWMAWRPVLKWSVPVGAAAAFGVAFLSINSVGTVAQENSSSPSTAPEVAQTELPVASAPGVAEMTPLEVASLDRASPSPVEIVRVAASSSSEATQAAQEERAVSAASQPRSYASVASVSEQVVAVPVAADSEIEERAVFASALAPVESSRSDFGELFERAFAQLDNGFKTVRQPSSDPLTQLTTPRDARRARLLAFTSAVDPNSPQYSSASNVIRSRERITNHLNDEALYDSIRRMGVKGNGVSIQF